MTSAGITAADIDFTSIRDERFSRVADGRYILSRPDLSTDIEVSRVRVDRGETRAQVKVYCGLAGSQAYNGVLFTSEITLSRFSGRRDLASALARRTNAQSVNWAAVVDELTIRVEEAESTGTPVTNLADVSLPSPGATPFLVGGFWPLFLKDPNCIYSHGGVGKSLLATWAGGVLTKAGIPTLIIDYEMSESPQAARLDALFGGDRPPVSHYRAARPLVLEVDRLETIVHDRGIGFIVLDSAVPAAMGNANDADAAAGVYGALRRLGVGSLVVAHVTKSSFSKDAKPDDATPYGSAFWWNLARSAWHLRRASESAEGTRQTLGLFHSKHNYGAFPAIGLEVDFSGGRISIARTDAAAVPEFAGSVSIQQRLRHALKRGPKSVEDLVNELDEKPDTVRRTIRRYSPGGGGKVVMFTRVGEDLVALADSRNA